MPLPPPAPHTHTPLCFCLPPALWKGLSHSWVSSYVTRPATCSLCPPRGQRLPQPDSSFWFSAVDSFCQLPLGGLSDTAPVFRPHKALSSAPNIGRLRGKHLCTYVYEFPLAAVAKQRELKTRQIQNLTALKARGPKWISLS